MAYLNGRAAIHPSSASPQATTTASPITKPAAVSCSGMMRHLSMTGAAA